MKEIRNINVLISSSSEFSMKHVLNKDLLRPAFACSRRPPCRWGSNPWHGALGSREGEGEPPNRGRSLCKRCVYRSRKEAKDSESSFFLNEIQLPQVKIKSHIV